MSLWERINNWFRTALGGERSPAPVTKKGDQAIMAPARKYLINMLNSLSLSSDMSTLFLIDNGRAIAFKLDDPHGVIIGKLGNQLAAVTGVDKFELLDMTASPAAETSRAKAMSQKYPVNSNAQWTLTYNEENNVMAIIGVTDINGGLTPDSQHDCSQDLFQLDEGPVRIALRGNVLVISQFSGGFAPN
jgi:hypothetical protein